MPKSTLSARRLVDALGADVPRERLDAALFASKAEATFGPGDDLEVSVTPDRLDLLSEGGLALHLQGALGLARGGVRRRRGRPAPDRLRITVDPSVVPLRPYIAAVRVQAPPGRPLDEGLLAEAVRFQELIHATVGRDRRAMSLGIYPARRLRTPIRYAREPVDRVAFVPLDGPSRLGARAFYADHPLAARYGTLGRSGDSCLTLRDAEGRVLSLPPVLNDREHGQANVGDRALLLEATGTRERAVREGLGLLEVVFAARGWSTLSVPVEGAEGVGSDGEGLVADRRLELPGSVLAAVAGPGAPSSEVVGRLGAARLSARRVRGGWRVAVPPWRPDLLAAVDLAEEVILAGGLRSEDGIVPSSSVRGRRRAESSFRREIRGLLLGLGFVEPLTTVLVSDTSAARLEGGRALRLANPVSREFAVVRDRLLLSHLDVLARNTRHGYPQRFAEVAPVVVPTPGSGTGGATRVKAGMIVAAEGAGFAEVAATVDYLLRTLDVGSVREPAELPGTIPGRAARVRVAGETVAELGELHPRLLVGLGVPVPVAWAEVDLTALGPLVARRDTGK
jgi:phenylalanyl-tRNA synthetase beta chain